MIACSGCHCCRVLTQLTGHHTPGRSLSHSHTHTTDSGHMAGRAQTCDSAHPRCLFVVYVLATSKVVSGRALLTSGSAHPRCLFVVYVLATSMVASDRTLTCDSAHPRFLFVLYVLATAKVLSGRTLTCDSTCIGIALLKLV